MAGKLNFVDPSQASGQLTLVGTTGVDFGNGIKFHHADSVKTAAQGGAVSKGNFTAYFGSDLNTSAPAENPITLTGKFSTKDFSASGKVTFPMGGGAISATGTWTASLAPLNPVPTSFSMDVGYRTNSANTLLITGEVFVNGSVQSSPSPTTPIANVVFAWADATGKAVGSIKDKVPVYWNTNSVVFELSKYPVPPPAATQLMTSVTYQGKTTSTSTPLLSPPKIRIDEAIADLPPGGKGTMQFVVTLLSPILRNVSFEYTTIDGSGVVNQDYVKKSGKLTFKPGGPLSQTISVSVKDDRDSHTVEAFSLKGSNPVNGIFVWDSALGIIAIS